jgi:methylmalonyl-CoA mutase N-terminal domain/subunit
LEIAEASFHYQQQLEAGEKTMIGVNRYVTGDAPKIPLVEIDEAVEKEQTARLMSVRRKRDGKAVLKSLDEVRRACREGKNVMPYCIEAVKNLASVQEICDVYREVYGEYRDPGLF